MDLQGRLLRKAKELAMANDKLAKKDERIQNLEQKICLLKEKLESEGTPLKKVKIDGKRICTSPCKEDLYSELRLLKSSHNKLETRYKCLQESERSRFPSFLTSETRKLRQSSQENLELLSKLNELQANRLLEESFSLEYNN